MLTAVTVARTIEMVGKSGVTEPRYRLGERIATGGMAEVYRAVALGAEGFERPVVLKRILPDLASESGFREMFIEEARVMASLSHRNVVQVFDFGILDDAFYLAVELVDGENLREALVAQKKTGVPVSPRLAAHVVAEALRGLDYAHRKTGADGSALGIVHRDVSPENILVSFEGEVKVADFGIAKTKDALRRTDPGRVKGKLLYLSPEVLHGRQADARSDIFAAGLVLFEAIAGRHPFEEEEAEARVLRRIATGDIPAFRAFRPNAPPGLAAVVDRALAAAPEARFQSAGDMARELDAFVATGGVAERVGPDEVARWLRALSPGARTAPGGGWKTTAPSDPFSGELVRMRGGGSGAVPRLTLVPTAHVAPESVVAGARGERRWLLALMAATIVALGAVLAVSLATDWFGARPATPPSGGPQAQPTVAATTPETAPQPTTASTAPRATETVSPVSSSPRMAPTAAPASSRAPDLVQLPPTTRPGLTAISRAKLVPPRRPPRETARPAVARTSAVSPLHVEAPAPEPAVIGINSFPWANIFVDGREVGETPIRDLRLAAGSHTIRFVCGNGRAETRRVKLAPGERGRVESWDCEGR